MKLSFQIDYRTEWGESVGLGLTYLTQGGRETHKDLYLQTADGHTWRGELTLPPAAVSVRYAYDIRRDGQVVRRESMLMPHIAQLATGLKRMVVQDRWRETPEDAYALSSAFTDVFMQRPQAAWPQADDERILIIRTYAHDLPKGCVLGVSGSCEQLGVWKPGSEIKMTMVAPDEWAFALDLSALDGPIEYKFLALDEQTGEQRGWEMRDNRYLVPPRMERQMQWAMEVEDARLPFAPWRGAGVVVPVFSLRSEGSFGVGDFGDLRSMVDWAVECGWHVIQILPINDTTITGTWTDSYPYNSNSVYALHPQYVDLRQLPPLQDAKAKAELEALRQEINALPVVDYERANEAKRRYLRLLFDQEGIPALQTPEFKAFRQQNAHWVIPYARYCAERCPYGWRTPEIHLWVQYLLDKQLREATAYARSKGVALKGDIPIGISRQSVEALNEPHLFHMDGQAGAPPDAFAEDGQNWGFPTYNWEAMQLDGCLWWRQRMQHMARYFDAFRIDHVLGFFRIWEIPVGFSSGLMGQFQPALPLTPEEIEGRGLIWREQTYTEAPPQGKPEDVLFVRDRNRPETFHPRIMGQKTWAYAQLGKWEREAYDRIYDDFFYHRHTDFWREEAMKKLPGLVSSTRMLVCAEDLGMVPSCVPSVMDELRILSLEIQSMPKNPAYDVGHTWEYPYRSVATISTHDMPTLRQMQGDDPDVALACVEQHLNAPSMLCLLSFQDWMAIDPAMRTPMADAERINVPANPRHYWRWRMHITIEKLMEAKAYNSRIKGLVKQYQR